MLPHKPWHLSCRAMTEQITGITARQITGTDVVNVSDIVAESNTPASIDLSACKIWLEATDSTGKSDLCGQCN